MTEVIEAIERAVGPTGVVRGEEVAKRGTGWGRTDTCVAPAVIRPRSTDEVAAVLRICHHARQPVVVQGGLTGLVSGAVPTESELVVSLERMTDIEEVDRDNRTMTVQAGVPLQAIQERAEASGLLFPLDLGARGSATIGGIVATNAGGNRVIRYGMARESVLGLEAVLADGTVLTSLNRMIKNNAGYDLKHLFIGSEGTLGVVTRLVLRLRPRPRSHDTALVAVQEFAHLPALLRRVDEGLGGTLSAYEVMWNEFYRLVTAPPARNRPPMSSDHPYYVLMESLGGDPDGDASRLERLLEECAAEGLVADAVFAHSRTEREALWGMRDDVEQLSRLGPGLIVFDVSLPIGEMESYLEELRRDLSGPWPAHRFVTFGHMGDGNLHLAIASGSEAEEDRRKLEEIVYQPLSRRGGSVSAEHGIGLDKRAYLHLSRSDAEIALMRSLKRALDPRGILNPGRVLPPVEA